MCSDSRNRSTNPVSDSFVNHFSCFKEGSVCFEQNKFCKPQDVGQSLLQFTFHILIRFVPLIHRQQANFVLNVLSSTDTNQCDQTSPPQQQQPAIRTYHESVQSNLQSRNIIPNIHFNIISYVTTLQRNVNIFQPKYRSVSCHFSHFPVRSVPLSSRYSSDLFVSKHSRSELSPQSHLAGVQTESVSHSVIQAVIQSHTQSGNKSGSHTASQ